MLVICIFYFKNLINLKITRILASVILFCLYHFFYFSFFCSLPSFILYFLLLFRFTFHFKIHLVVVVLLSLFETIFIYVCLHDSMCLCIWVPRKYRRGHYMSRSWSLRWLWAAWYGFWYQTWVFWKTSKCSYLLDHLSSCCNLNLFV